MCLPKTWFEFPALNSGTADSRAQLPAPRNPKVHLYNAEQVLSWEPGSLSNDTRPVVYQVQFKYPSDSRWYDTRDIGVDCMNVTTTECNFTPTSLSNGFPPHFNVSLRVRAKLEDLVSPWLSVPWFLYYWNDSRAQLPAPRNPKVHLYNAEQVLSWEPGSLSNDTRPVVYQVQFK
ncbi:interferon gamma receptor 2-like [Mirounga angustirostris]|uniref:interferon gamma receptor 2-like n=1 Tax=Mirounga angustirostris TaxID=9716 RepID=UPI00313B1089